MTGNGNAELETLPKWQEPAAAELNGGSYTIRYGPAAVSAVEEAASSIGTVIVQFAEAERNLEAIYTGLFASRAPAVIPLLRGFRDHRRLLALIVDTYQTAGQGELATSLSAVSPLLHSGWVVRDRLAHAVWASSSQYQSAAILLKVTALTREQAAFQAGFATDPMGALDRMKPLPGEGEIRPQLWLAEDFRRAAAMARGTVNTLLALQLCGGGSPKAPKLHAAMRRPGLLAEPPFPL